MSVDDVIDRLGRFFDRHSERLGNGVLKDAPRRIIGLPSEVRIPLPKDHPQRELLEQTALNCPVHKSLPVEINRPTKFFWEG